VKTLTEIINFPVYDLTKPEAKDSLLSVQTFLGRKRFFRRGFRNSWERKLCYL